MNNIKPNQGVAYKPVTLAQRIMTYCVLTLFIVQPAMAKVVVSGGNTTVETAANGVEVVNIATPNSKGLSHNKYQQFDVDPSGLVLNNSNEQFKRSQLAGILQNNPNLNQSGPATVILNEVTGANRSQLQGYTEVLGQSANVILTNPYGITCHGCGFINTPRVTLSTGIANIQNGEVLGFEVTQGSVSIEGLGLDATQQTYFDIITRAALINADIHANELNVITGQNRGDYQSNAVTQRNHDSNRPALAIDSSLLGGMYAGSISLVATEAGVGVNIGNLAANQGNLAITADGNIALRDASATGDIHIVSHDSLTLDGQQTASGHITLQAAEIAANDNKLTANQNLTLSANKVQATESEIAAGKALSLTADSATLTDSVLEANSLAAQVKTLNLDSNSAIKTEQTTLTGLMTLVNDGELSASNQLTVSGNNATLSGAGAITANAAQLNADNLTLDTKLETDTLAANVSDTLTHKANLIVVDTLSIDTWSSSPKELPLQALTEPYVNLSTHTALIVRPFNKYQ